MTTSTTMTIRTRSAVEGKAGEIGGRNTAQPILPRSRSFLAAEAVETYVDRELAIIEGIERGLADVEAGRTVSHEDAMASVRRAIEVAARGSA